MVHRIEVRPTNSIVFVHGGGQFVVPAETFEPGTSLVAASTSCLIVGLYPEVDGPTQITIGRASDIDPGWPAEFSGVIKSPKGRIIVDTVDEQIVHEQLVDTDLTAIKVWLSHRRWPENVFIAVG